MKFVHSTVYARDLDATIKFYEDIMGLKLARRFKTDNNQEIAFMDAGGVELEFIHYENGYTPAIGVQPSWAFEPEDYDAMLKYIEESDEYRVEKGPVEVPGARFFFFYDMNGVCIQIIQHK